MSSRREMWNCTNLENALVIPHGEIYPTLHDANQAMNVKAEAVSDAEEEEDPVPITFPEIKAEVEGNLNELQPIHGEDRQYSCNECGESFSQHIILRAHQHIHSGEEPFCCIVCTMSFSCKSLLKVHQCIHSEKPFCCIVCNKSFSHQSHLKTHQHVHSGEKPFYCDVCNKSFRKQNHLKTHQHIHSGKKPFY
ncbi:gastrula zinc finger protein XlCGF7.1-like [Cryptotermes secundus]|uniref:gastrula zinc finger protein XlCGF7.1-like n=1 Tax=Cryptotermes secundus TaxID=105785 RepID=UPI000CD7C95D|nr:gastrula zinc finger protein XlCGF7.1-like [Cryptotermes secundus]